MRVKRVKFLAVEDLRSSGSGGETLFTQSFQTPTAEWTLYLFGTVPRLSSFAYILTWPFHDFLMINDKALASTTKLTHTTTIT